MKSLCLLRLLAWLGLLGILAGAGTARADDASLGRLGEGVMPINSTEVAMVAERVRLEVTPDRTRVEAVFVFRNPGPATTLLVGFPEAEGPPSEPGELGEDTSLHEFRAWVGGQEVPVKLEKGLPANPPSGTENSTAGSLPAYPAWYTFTLSLAAGETVEVKNTYWVKNTRWSNGEAETGYILRTGTVWAGPIGSIRVEMVLAGIAPYQVLGGRPGNWRLEGENTYVWESKDLEPDQDITLRFTTRPAIAFFGERSEADALLEAGRYTEALPVLTGELGEPDLSAARREALLFRRALALQQLCRLEEAADLWEEILALPWRDGAETKEKTTAPGEPSSSPEDLAFTYRAAADPAAYYYLGEIYRQQGEVNCLTRLYHLVNQREIGLPLQRWLERFVPEEERLAPSPPRLLNSVVVPDGADTNEYPIFEAELADADGNLEGWSLTVWTEENGKKVIRHSGQGLTWYGHTYREKVSERVLFHLSPGTAVRYEFKAWDGDGQVVTSGEQVWTAPESGDHPWSQPLGFLEITGRIQKAGPLPGPASTAGEEKAPAPGGSTNGQALVAIGHLHAEPQGGKTYLRLADGRELEVAGSARYTASSGLSLVQGQLVGRQLWAARAMSLRGDLAKQAALRPYLRPVPELRLRLDNGREVRFRSPPLLLSGSTLVDMLEVAEILDLSLGYHPGSQVVTFEGRGRPLKLGVEDNSYSGYHGMGRHASAVVRYNGRIYIPLRFVLEHYGYLVTYHPAERLITAAPFTVQGGTGTAGGG